MVTIRYAAVRLQRVPQTRATGPKQSRGFTGLGATLMPGLCMAALATAVLGGRRYIDPGSGSFAIQIIIAAVLSGLLTARLWLRHILWRVLALVRRKKAEEQPAGEEADR